MALSRRLTLLLMIAGSSWALLSAARPARADTHQSPSHKAFAHFGRSCPRTNAKRAHHRRGACTRRVPRRNLRGAFAASVPGLAFGKTTVGVSSDSFLSSRKRVNRYALPTNGSVTALTVLVST